MKEPQRNRGDANTRRRTINPEPEAGKTPAEPTIALARAIEEAIGFFELFSSRLLVELERHERIDYAAGIESLAASGKEELRAQLAAPALALELVVKRVGALAHLMLESLLPGLNDDEEAQNGICHLLCSVEDNLRREAVNFWDRRGGR
jgi:hypothetical protein